MKRFKTVDEYILNAQNGKEILMVLREIINSTELEETVKWGAPAYTFNGKNVLGLGSFKSYVGIWFYQGALLNDSAGVLINAQEDKTKAMRQWRFSSEEDLNEKTLLSYISESIENVKQNKEIKPDRSKPLLIPDELKAEFEKSKELEVAFNNFTRGKQREFAEHISSAKQEKTRLSRLEKIIPLIEQGIGLHDKYRR